MRKYGPVSRGLNCILGITNFLSEIFTSPRKLIWSLTLNPSTADSSIFAFQETSFIDLCLRWNGRFLGSPSLCPFCGDKWLIGYTSFLFHQNNLRLWSSVILCLFCAYFVLFYDSSVRASLPPFQIAFREMFRVINTTALTPSNWTFLSSG